MANYGAVENCIEWLRGQDTITVSLSDPEVMAVIVDLSKHDKAVQVVDKSKHTLCARLPLDYLSIKKPRRKKSNDSAV